jgi:hypothetical protein
MWDETFAVLLAWKPCVITLSLGKFTSGSYATTKMAPERTGLVKKHYSAYTLFSDCFHPQTDKSYINKRLKEGKN